MKKTVLTFGIIAGLIIGGMLFITMPMIKDGKMDNGMLVGYATMVIAFSTIFVGIRQYRDKYLGGFINFGKAFLAGIYITLIASFLYAACWEVVLAISGTTPQEFMEACTRVELDKMKAKGAPAEAIEEAIAQTKAINGWYGNMIPRFLFTMMVESFPVGIIVSLIAAGILKKSHKVAL